MYARFTALAGVWSSVDCLSSGRLASLAFERVDKELVPAAQSRDSQALTYSLQERFAASKMHPKEAKCCWYARARLEVLAECGCLLAFPQVHNPIIIIFNSFGYKLDSYIFWILRFLEKGLHRWIP